MKFRIAGRKFGIGAFVGTSLIAALLLISQPAASQNKATPMAPDGHPDLTGYWTAVANDVGGFGSAQFQRTSDGSILYDFGFDQGKVPLCTGDACQFSNQPSYSPAFLPKVKAIAASEFAGTTPQDPAKDCKPQGVPRAAIGNVQIIQSPTIIAMIHGSYEDRIIYMDSPHPADVEPSYMGDSRGHWEGNTLVVDVTGLNEDTWIGGGGATGDGGDRTIYTSIHSDKEHVVERYTREGDTITYEATVDDPVALTKPWVIAPRKIHIGKPDDYLITYFCDGGGVSAFMKEHYVKPNPEDRDIKYKCSGHRCDVPPEDKKSTTK